MSGQDLPDHGVPLLTPKGGLHKIELDIEQEQDQFDLTISFFDIEGNSHRIRSKLDQTRTVRLVSVVELSS